jgi:hypothetical protein
MSRLLASSYNFSLLIEAQSLLDFVAELGLTLAGALVVEPLALLAGRSGGLLRGGGGTEEADGSRVARAYLIATTDAANATAVRIVVLARATR